ncbi:MAG: hypothetical protein AAF850_03625 [Pseudomonadota bacterium]
MITVVGVVSFGAFIVVVASILRQLGASEVAKGLLIFTVIAVAAAFSVTYLPSLLLP